MVAEHITNLPVTGKDSGRRSRTQLLLLHSGETPLELGYAVSVTRNWLNRSDVEASTHVFAGPETLVRSVNTAMAAWHASVANGCSIGYEQTGYAALTRAQWLTVNGKNQMDRLAREMAADAKLYGIPLRWLSTDDVRRVLNGNTTIKGFCTHAQVDPASRTDPGTGYPYDLLMAAIEAYSGVKPTPTPTPAKPSVKPTPTKPQFTATVEKGDTLTSIARQFGTTVTAIKAINKGIDPNRIAVGQKIQVPGIYKAPAPKPKPAATAVNRYVTNDVAHARTRPYANAPIAVSIDKGQPLGIVGYVGGQDPYGTGDSAWYKTTGGYYVWANAAQNNVEGLTFLGNM